jgi:hypothetical protein
VEREALRSAINHGGGYILVTEQFLNGAYVGARFEQVGGKAVSNGVGGSRLGYSCSPGGSFDGALQQAFVKMMAANGARARVGRNVGSGEKRTASPIRELRLDTCDRAPGAARRGPSRWRGPADGERAQIADGPAGVR